MTKAWRYSGEADQSARLKAARITAGFKTAREAAQRFGWSEPRYRSHEGAVRRIGHDTLREYANAFGVSEPWLKEGLVNQSEPYRDRDIHVDPAREQELVLRVKFQRRAAQEPEIDRGRRLRLARRLAGFPSAASAAAAAGVHRSTINSHERAVVGFEDLAARAYATAFGCEPAWLTSGSMPSGYPSHIEGMLGQLLEYHDLTDVEAASHLPPYQPPSRSSGPRPVWEPQSISLASGRTLPEYEVGGLVRLLTEPDRLGRPAVLQGWSIPTPFLGGVLRADLESCVMVVIPKVVSTGTLSVAPGDRLIVDTSVTEVFSAPYALVCNDAIEIADARTEGGRHLAVAAARRMDGYTLLGQIVGAVTSVR